MERMIWYGVRIYQDENIMLLKFHSDLKFILIQMSVYKSSVSVNKNRLSALMLNEYIW